MLGPSHLQDFVTKPQNLIFQGLADRVPPAIDSHATELSCHL
jgi:hypothetical protein